MNFTPDIINTEFVENPDFVNLNLTVWIFWTVKEVQREKNETYSYSILNFIWFIGWIVCMAPIVSFLPPNDISDALDHHRHGCTSESSLKLRLFWQACAICTGLKWMAINESKGSRHEWCSPRLATVVRGMWLNLKFWTRLSFNLLSCATFGAAMKREKT